MQRRLPVRELARYRALGIIFVAQERVLPKRVVGILQGQRREDRRVAFTTRGIRGSEIASQRPERRSVAGNMVNEQQQNLLVRREDEEFDAERRFDGEIETTARGRSERPGERGRGGWRHRAGGPGECRYTHTLG